ncbi:hypothetical protein ENUP19_0294G0020 [Entamoeba nuttalli]|uniref:Rho guanine nucleotide exchange factor, putative n=2 Tax=Entamoeba nuttalli TaxID=412467 RepID=K2GZJ8_ENTNP|nr:Rho guanine nucleotide exchange factor, putative [Entamoeba nuttalli P19]EKE39392.1 Rho guanine nucleotide exchange factor, putative [Entamoeba nuttalli P19]|eukprot:XP_008858273.1 Rho guanine nucleotide exchange factor, putative [Entamoeba nuttalli P19]
MSESINVIDPLTKPIEKNNTNKEEEEKEEGKIKERISKRERIVDEIYTTEESYVKTLEQCIEYYYKPFLQCNELNETRKNEIFLYLPEVLSTATAFLKDMESYRNNKTLENKVVDCFKRFIPYLKVYKMFIGNNEICLHALAAIEKSPIVVSFLEQCRIKIPSKSQQPLRSILIMPVQRIPRYVLLLKDLLKNTDVSHSQYPIIQGVLKEVEELAQVCNAALLNTERMLKMFKIRDSIRGYSGELVNSSRYFVKEGFLTKQCRKTPKPRYFILFNDQLIYGSETMGIVTVSDDRIIDLLDCIITDIQDSPTRKFAFQIQSGNRSFVVFAKNQEDKKEWLDALNKSIEKQNGTITAKNTRSTVVRPVFKPDNEALNCELCHIDFTFVRRRHHCRACGRCICGECSKWKMPIPPNNTLERVCAKCFDLYNKNRLKQKDISTREKRLDTEMSKRSIFEQQKILSGGDINDSEQNDDWQEFEDIEFDKQPSPRSLSSTSIPPTQPKRSPSPVVGNTPQKIPLQHSSSMQTLPSSHLPQPKRKPPLPPNKPIPTPQPKQQLSHSTVGSSSSNLSVTQPPKKVPPQVPNKLRTSESALTQSTPLHQKSTSRLSQTNRLSYKSRPLPQPPVKSETSKPEII